ncbi:MULTISPECIES: hypothetical protein [unclassified Oceanispirochaeta]|uniref:hypothetical protein n=1 Tax=unclassified Oceanispirochaeta TaxID=2635722 RepID=UPI000E092C58|nr:MULTISPECIES: hypothetical protein [unclassified Oceanispirochaeta]MBF9018932.1 hypothetical protein [Oceanispirochaeta sp. M2]NPD75431.1 hypothetical protein [Oceanispirochaeta sp. M1]RDG28716.1 hypothetical protein DV872_25395 [Oceanispirochaeta sp. M1]
MTELIIELRKFRIKKIRFSIILLLALLNFSCTNKQNENKKKIDVGNFRYELFDDLSDWVVSDISEYLEKNYLRILEDLQIKHIPKTTIKIWFNEENFLEIQEMSIGNRYPGSTGYINNNEICILYTGNNTAETALHEFAHLVSLKINPELDNNPRWLWEAIAIYESNCPRLEPSRFSQLSVENYPTLSDLNTDFNSSQTIYDIGYTLTEFILYKWD